MLQFMRPIDQRIMELRALNLAREEIVDTLNNEGFKSPYGLRLTLKLLNFRFSMIEKHKYSRMGEEQKMVVDISKVIESADSALQYSKIELEAMQRLWRDIMTRSELNVDHNTYNDLLAWFENRPPELFQEIINLQRRNETLKSQLQVALKRIEYFAKKA